MWDLVSLKKVNEEEVARQKRAEVKRGMIAQPVTKPRPFKLINGQIRRNGPN